MPVNMLAGLAAPKRSAVDMAGVGLSPDATQMLGTMQQVPTAPQPQPQQAGPMDPSPFMTQPVKPRMNLLANAVDGFQRGFDPQGWQAGKDQAKADALEKQKQTLALMQQQRQLPPDQRAMWWQQNAPQISQIVGKDVSQAPVDPSQFSDQALDQHIAMLSAQMGQAPEAPTYMNLGGGNVGKVANGKFSMEREAPKERKYTAYKPGDIVYGDKDGDGIEEEIFRVPNDPAKDANLQLKEGANGNWWKFNPQTGGMEDTGVAAPKPSGGVTINMPGNVREGVDPTTGQPVFVGIDPKDPNGGFKTIPGATPPSNMMGAETRSKFMALAPNAYAGISKLRELFSGNENPLSGTGAVADVANAIPGIGGVIARGVGGQSWQDFDQAWNAIELGVHIPAGAAVSTSEAQRFLRANKPALNETKETTLRKLDNVERFYQGLEAGFKGDWNALSKLMSEPLPTQTAPGSKRGPVKPLDPEEQQMVNELRALGKSEAEINAIIGQ